MHKSISTPPPPHADINQIFLLFPHTECVLAVARVAYAKYVHVWQGLSLSSLESLVSGLVALYTCAAAAVVNISTRGEGLVVRVIYSYYNSAPIFCSLFLLPP